MPEKRKYKVRTKFRDPNYGGRRPGAGRPKAEPKTTLNVQFRLTQQELDRLNQKRIEDGIKTNKNLIYKLVLKYITQPKNLSDIENLS